MGNLCMQMTFRWWQTQGCTADYVGGGSSVCDDVADEVQQ